MSMIKTGAVQMSADQRSAAKLAGKEISKLSFEEIGQVAWLEVNGYLNKADLKKTHPRVGSCRKGSKSSQY